MQKEIVLITDRVHPLLPVGLRNLGYSVRYEPTMSLEDIQAMLPLLSGIVINSRVRMMRSWIEASERLLFIARLGSGMEIIDREAAAERGVAVFSAPEGNANAVAEHALGMLLALSNNLIRSDRQVRTFRWERELNRGWELAGKTVGILGMGHTGKAFARKLACMDVLLLAYDKYAPSWQEEFPFVKPVSPDELRGTCDVLSVHLPLSGETHHLINKVWLQSCRTGQVLINTSRGNHVDTAALVEALQTGRLAGACLDVFENERSDTMSVDERTMYAALYGMEQVVLSPHIAGWSRESLEGIAQVLLRKVANWQKAI